MAAEIDADAYVKPRPPHEASLQVGFTPSPMLNTALRGFLLHEHTEGRRDDIKTARTIGNIVLRSLRRQNVTYDKHTSGEIRYVYDSELIAEQKRIEKLRDDIVTVADIKLAMADNQDMIVALRLAPTYEQRQELSGLVLGDLSEDGLDYNLDVYARLRSGDIADPTQILQQAREIKQKLAGYRNARLQQPLEDIRNPYFVRAPKVIPADPVKPRIIP